MSMLIIFNSLSLLEKNKRNFNFHFSTISKIHPCRTLLRAAPTSDDEVVFEDFELALEVIHTKTERGK